jgi:uncharacterized membrane protein YdjX (TVP38/TMEM64 family)
MKKYYKLLVFISLIIVVILLWIFDVFTYISIERIQELKYLINGFGILSPIIFVVIYIFATVFFLPGVPLTLVAGIVFGPIIGSILVSIASTIGASLAFLIGRYTGRDWILNKFFKSDIFIKLDAGVKEQGWKMIAITRLIPLFPFNAQNYVYGLTDIGFKTYVLVSWLCMLPGTIAYVFLSGAIIGGQGDSIKTITYIGIGFAILILLSIFGKKYINNKGELKDD